MHVYTGKDPQGWFEKPALPRLSNKPTTPIDQTTCLDERADDAEAGEAEVLEGAALAHDGVEEGVQVHGNVRCVHVMDVMDVDAWMCTA